MTESSTSARSEPRLTSLSHGGGCGCKIAPDVLAELLKGQPAGDTYKDLLVGSETSDDAAVYRSNESQAIVSTTDFFMPIVDDPFDFGRIAATNALSDIYAMGGASALCVGDPRDARQYAVAGRRSGEILRGGEIGVPAGRHSSGRGTQYRFGRADLRPRGHWVVVIPRSVKRNSGARAGDVLILGKPLGVGILSAALKKGRAGRGRLSRDDRGDDAAQRAG